MAKTNEEKVRHQSAAKARRQKEARAQNQRKAAKNPARRKRNRQIGSILMDTEWSLHVEVTATRGPIVCRSLPLCRYCSTRSTSTA